MLALAAKLWADSLYFAFDGLWGRGDHLSLNFLAWPPESRELFRSVLGFIVPNIFKLKLQNFDTGFVLIFDIACAIGILWAPWAKLPKFIPQFENVGRVPERMQAPRLA